jgi:CRP-like cAMP-binding protein
MNPALVAWSSSSIPKRQTPEVPARYSRRTAPISGRCDVVTKKERLERLGSVRLFEDLSKTELKYLNDISKIVNHDEGHTIIAEGDSGAGFQLILEGEARVVRSGRTVVRLGPGEFFGEMALIDEGPRTADVIAATPMTTLGISGWDFRPLVQRRPEMAWKLLVHLTGRLRESQKREDGLRA